MPYPVLPAFLGGKKMDQEWNILRPLSQRRDDDGKDIKAEIEIRAETSLLHHAAEIPVCGGDNSDINLLFLGTAYAFKHAVLKDF